jgi:alkylhydroperoxidase family enzyme
MTQFPLHTPSTAPALSKAILAQIGKAGAEAPNLVRALAEAPAALTAFQQLKAAFASSSLSPIEQEVVYLSVAKANECHYCTTQTGAFDSSPEAHAAADAIRGGRPIRDPRLQALRRFAMAMTSQRGWVSDTHIEDFLAAGYIRAQVLEVISGIALATLSSYVNHVAATPIDAGVHGQPLDA